MSVIGYDNPGEAGFPSPAVWGDCPNTLLNDKGLGYFVQANAFGDETTLPGKLITDADGSTTYTYDTGTGDERAVDVAVSGTDNNAVALHTRPLAKVVKGSGVKLWAEADIALAAITDQAFFFGFAEDAALDRDIVADDPSNSAQAGLDTESLIGFVSQQNTSATDKIDAVYRKDNGSVVTVLADVGNASAFDPTNTTGVGFDRDNAAQTATKPGDLAADEFVRLGVSFNGRDKLTWYVNGLRVVDQEVDSTVDKSKEYGAILALKTGAAAARTLRYRFVRAAAQLRY